MSSKRTSPSGNNDAKPDEDRSEGSGSGDNVCAVAPKKDKRESLKSFMGRMRQTRAAQYELTVFDVYEKAARMAPLARKMTGIVYDDSMVLHKCEWDDNYPENPDRYTCVMNRLKELGLIERCKLIASEKAQFEDVAEVHSPRFVGNLERISKLEDIEKQEEEASKYDAVYFNKDTYDCALTSAGCVLALLKELCAGNVQNGFAVVRPPGHHAMKGKYCGYCYFNNVAIAARYALKRNWARRILIVDFDVHHGQATQQEFYEETQVLYFSIHRYEHGAFWPNLRESDVDFIGIDNGKGFNINVPLNTTGLGDDDYMAIVCNILLPAAYEYQPDLVIVSAGYDACIGCFEGCMNVTPGFYGHLITLLSGLAEGKILVCLEGGYFLPSLAEGVAMTLKSLLGDAPAVLPPLKQPNEVVIDTMNNLRYYLRPYWKCFKNITELSEDDDDTPLHKVELKYCGKRGEAPFLTRNCYPVHEEGSVERNEAIINDLKRAYEQLMSVQVVSYSFCETVLEHRPPRGKDYPETPERIKAAIDKFKESHLDERCIFVAPQEVDIALLESVHDPEYLQKIQENDVEVTADIYRSPKTWESVKRCVECFVSVIDSVLTNESRSGVALIRPPGHHAEHDACAGFCFVNNVCVGANYALEQYSLKRILILDFDVHHGNGTQHYFYDSPHVLYISIHRYDNGKFYPKSKEGNYNFTGVGDGEGYNVNIPLNAERVDGFEYMELFHRLVLPISYSFAPELVLVSAGFDAGVNDPLGGYKVVPEAFGHFIQMIKPLAGGKVIIVTEGGYNPTTVSHSLTMCVKALLGDPLPRLEGRYFIRKPIIRTIENVIEAHSKYWPVLKVNKPFPNSNVVLESVFRNLNLRSSSRSANDD